MSPKLAISKDRIVFSLLLSLALYFLLSRYDAGAQAFSFTGSQEGLRAASLPALQSGLSRLQLEEVAQPRTWRVQAGLIPVAQETTPASNADSPTLTSTPSVTPVPTETPGPHRRPTRTPRPTSTPPTIPPPQDPGTTNILIIFGSMVVVVILFGVWLNRKNTI